MLLCDISVSCVATVGGGDFEVKVPDLNIVYKTANFFFLKSRGTKVELISSAKILAEEILEEKNLNTGTDFAEARQSRNATLADDGEEASPQNSPTALSGLERCEACLVLIPQDWLFCF